jgi:hypothetical protein
MAKGLIPLVVSGPDLVVLNGAITQARKSSLVRSTPCYGSRDGSDFPGSDTYRSTSALHTSSSTSVIVPGLPSFGQVTPEGGGLITPWELSRATILSVPASRRPGLMWCTVMDGGPGCR